jgi:acyl-CoA thioester hydrolase
VRVYELRSMDMNRAAEFPIVLKIPVAWGEQDLFGHVNNIVYFRYFESVRMHFLDRIGVLRSHREQGIGVILASTTCDFKKPVEWPQQLVVRTGCDHVGNTSFTMQYEIVNELGDVVASGSSVQVMYDYTKRHKVPVPDEVISAIAALMGA